MAAEGKELPEKFLSLFHQVMGVKLPGASREFEREEVSIPFSSGHGGKEKKG